MTPYRCRHVSLRCDAENQNCQIYLQHVNSSTSPERHKSKWPVNWVKNRVNFIVSVSDINKRCCHIMKGLLFPLPYTSVHILQTINVFF